LHGTPVKINEWYIQKGEKEEKNDELPYCVGDLTERNREKIE